MNSSIHTTPVNGLSTPPSHERMGEPARRSLFLNSPGMLEAMRPYARRLNFSETNSSLATNGSPRFMTSTPAQNGTVTLGSSPWQTSLNITGLNNLLPPMEGPQPQEVIQQTLSFTSLTKWRFTEGGPKHLGPKSNNGIHGCGYHNQNIHPHPQ